jgi:hypothetical protein
VLQQSYNHIDVYFFKIEKLFLCNNKANMSEAMDKGSQALQQIAETIGDTIVGVLDKLAGTKSDLKLTFEDLTLDAQFFKARVNSAVVLDVTLQKKLEHPQVNSFR